MSACLSLITDQVGGAGICVQNYEISVINLDHPASSGGGNCLQLKSALLALGSR